MLTLDDAAESSPLWLLSEAELPAWLAAQPPELARWVRSQGFQAEKHRVVTLPAPNGEVSGAVVGLGALASHDDLRLWHAAGLPDRLPAQTWRVASSLSPAAATHFTLGWLMGSYRFARYRAAPAGERPSLIPPSGTDLAYARAAAEATAFARDLINTPANDLGPAELAQAASDLAARTGGQCSVLVGDELVSNRFPLIHAVGAASAREPRLIDLRWGEATGPRITLVGKGVCFDSGGLDVKPASGMQLMKKDMGGAACVLALAQLLVALDTRVRLRVLIPAVENSISGHAYRPGDVLRSRKGLTIEIGNTDAEGRLVLADALAEADGERPDLLIDLATLTGAARVALGPELPAAYSPQESLLTELRAHGEAEADPIWPMPLWSAYDEELSSKVADLANASATPQAGSVIAALFLKRFVTCSSWVHVDLFAWNPKDRPGRPVGAEAQCVRSLYRLIRARCA